MSMTQTKHKKTVQSKKKLSKRLRISEHRARAARIKAKVERHRKKHKQAKTSKGFFAIVGSYINRKLQIDKDFQGTPFEKKANSKYSTADMIRSLVCLVIMGIKRVYHANSHQDEHILANMIGLSKFPSATTIYRFLKAFGNLTFCKRVQRANRDQITQHIAQAKEIICDGDTSTIQTHGNHKDGSVKGFNKNRPGSFCLQASQYFVNGMSIKPDMLPGNKVPQEAFKTFCDLKEVRRICGRLDWVRLDAGFISLQMLNYLDGFSRSGNSTEKIKYIVNVGMKCIGSIQAKNRSDFRKWTKLGKGVFMQDHGLCQIYNDDQKLRRLLLIKEFFPGGKDKGEWKYYALCSNEEHMPAKDLYYFYHQRQTIENFFDEAKNDYHLEHLPCTKIMGNALYFNILCLAFNMVYLFRLANLRKQDHKIRLSTFQRTYIELQMEFDGKILYIFRSAYFYYRRITAILRRLMKLDIVLEYRFC